MKHVMHKPEPRFIVEVGEEEHLNMGHNGEVASSTIIWRFAEAWTSYPIAEVRADELARRNKHVRVIDREIREARS